MSNINNLGESYVALLTRHLNILTLFHQTKELTPEMINRGTTGRFRSNWWRLLDERIDGNYVVRLMTDLNGSKSAILDVLYDQDWKRLDVKFSPSTKDREVIMNATNYRILEQRAEALRVTSFLIISNVMMIENDSSLSQEEKEKALRDNQPSINNAGDGFPAREPSPLMTEPSAYYTPKLKVVKG